MTFKTFHINTPFIVCHKFDFLAIKYLNLIFLTKLNILCYNYIIHKECARDSPVDHTATCMCKVLKADRWAI